MKIDSDVFEGHWLTQSNEWLYTSYISGMLLGSHTKISYLGIHVRIQQHILWFQVSVNHHVPMTVIYS